MFVTYSKYTKCMCHPLNVSVGCQEDGEAAEQGRPHRGGGVAVVGAVGALVGPTHLPCTKYY